MDLNEVLVALHESSAHLARAVAPLDADALRARAYPSEWSVADVLSHLGSAALITRAEIDANLAGEDLAADYAQPIWDEWNAKSPEAKAADGLTADRAYLDYLDSLTTDERARFRLALGPLDLDLAAFLGLRLNEHALHTWDIEVMAEPAATLPQYAARLVVDNLSMITRFTGKPTGAAHDFGIRTSDPTRDFTLALGETVALTPATGDGVPDLELPAEALVRLVYGRLDPEHTPPTRGGADLAELRRVLPGP